MGNLFSGWHIVILLLVVLLLFGAPKLPGLAKSLGESMRIFRREVKQINEDDAKSAETSGKDDSQGKPES